MPTPEELLAETKCGFIISALKNAGYVIVPKEPTEEMLKAAVDESEQIQSDPCPFWAHEFVPIWRAMLAAAQTKEAGQPEG